MIQTRSKYRRILVKVKTFIIQFTKKELLLKFQKNVYFIINLLEKKIR